MEPSEKKSKKKEEEDDYEDVEEGDEEEEEEETFEKNPDLLDKYKTAANITKEVLAFVAKLCVAGADIAEICSKGDKKIDELVTTAQFTLRK